MSRPHSGYETIVVHVAVEFNETDHEAVDSEMCQFCGTEVHVVLGDCSFYSNIVVAGVRQAYVRFSGIAIDLGFD